MKRRSFIGCSVALTSLLLPVVAAGRIADRPTEASNRVAATPDAEERLATRLIR